MADFETKLRWLSERGNPVGAEELIERIEADLAGDPLVVITRRREGILMTKTQQTPTTGQPPRNRGPAWAVAAFVGVLAVAGLYLAFSGDEEAEVADTAPTPTTLAESMTDLETIQTGVAAFYSGDAERAAELFELNDRTDDEIRAESAYQAAIGGRLDLSCAESTTPGSFTCRTPYRNAMTDAIGVDGGNDVWPVLVEDGVITEFGFTEHSQMVIEMGIFLASEGRFDGYEDCGFGPFPESCATIQLENLDAWVEWRENARPADSVAAAMESWYRGDCEAARFLSETDIDCSTSSPAAQTIEYESILGALISVESCETTSGGDHTGLSCEVHYSNAMSSAVGKAPSVSAREFVLNHGVFLSGPNGTPWYESSYPEDTELRESFRLFAESGELADDYAATDCADTRSPECANLMIENLDSWAAWYQANG